jgi:hypothetical protein
MFFMKFPIDAVFLNNDNSILAVETLKPWRLSKLHFKAKKVLELPAGASKNYGWKAGDKLEILSQEGVLL